LDLCDVYEIKISAPQCPTHSSPTGNDDALDIAVHQSIGLSSIIVPDMRDSYRLPIVLHILDHVKTKNLSEPAEKFTVGKVFKALTLI
jgi:hypothetical protein